MFCWHKWSEWGTHKREVRYLLKEGWVFNGKEYIQRRHCMKCNKEQHREID